MARHAPSNGHAAPERGYRVELPRSSDAIGVVLRDAYERDLGLPDDMMLLLRKLSAPPATTRGR